MKFISSHAATSARHPHSTQGNKPHTVVVRSGTSLSALEEKGPQAGLNAIICPRSAPLVTLVQIPKEHVPPVY